MYRQKDLVSLYEPRNPSYYAATQIIHQAIRNGEIILPDACEKCGSSKDKYLTRHFPEGYANPFTVVHVCRKCYFSINPMPRPELKPMTRPSYSEVKRLMRIEWTWDQIAERYGKNGAAVRQLFRNRARKLGEWEAFRDEIHQLQGKKTRRGAQEGNKGYVASGVGIYGLVSDWVDATGHFAVDSSGEVSKLSRITAINMVARRAGVDPGRLRMKIRHPQGMIQRPNAMKLLRAVNEPLPLGWSQSNLSRKKNLRKKAK